MDNIKLQGMKKLRNKRNIALKDVAKYLNLLNAEELNMVVTEEYLSKIESRKQKKIDDKLLNALSKYFEVPINDLIEVNDTSFSNVKKLEYRTINIKVPSEKRLFKAQLDVATVITDKFIGLASSMILDKVKSMEDDNDFEHYVNALDILFQQVLLFDDIEDLMNNEIACIRYINMYIDKLQHEDLIELSKCVAIVYKTYLDMNLDNETAFNFTVFIIQHLLDNDML